MTEPAIDRVAQWLDGTLPADDQPPPEIWALVEIFGFRKHYGRVREVSIVDVKMLRVDVPTLAAAPLLGEAEKFETFFYGGAAIFSFNPMTEEAARKWAAAERPQPINPLNRLPPPEHEGWEDEDRPF